MTDQSEYPGDAAEQEFAYEDATNRLGAVQYAVSVLADFVVALRGASNRANLASYAVDTAEWFDEATWLPDMPASAWAEMFSAPDQLVKLRGALALQEDALRDRLDQIREDAAAEGITLDPVTPQDVQA